MKNLTDLNFITNIDDLTQQVQNSFPSIFTKDDVLKLLDALKLNDAYFIEDESKEICGERLAILELIDNMKSDVEDCIAAYEPDLENYALQMNYSNEVTIESHEVDMQPLNNDVKDLVDSFREEFVKLILE
tara:strand:- start:4719 stop:5111 length:393 start_codon:yes stop_codon:yes gene_type:complete